MKKQSKFMIALIIVAIAVAFLTGCKKETEEPAPKVVYDNNLKTGLLKTNFVHNVNGIKRIWFGVPNDADENATISVFVGNHSQSNTGITATKGHPQEFITKDLATISFQSEPTDSSSMTVRVFVLE